MAPKQVPAEVTAMKLDRMRATRERIDLKLDLIRARATASTSAIGRVATGLASASGLLKFLFGPKRERR